MSGPQAPQIKTRTSKGVNYTPYDARWVPSSARLVAVGGYARGTGALQVYESCDGCASLTLVAECERPSSFKCATFGAAFDDTRHLATGDFSGRLSIWDPQRISGSSTTPVFSVAAHAGVVNCIDGVASDGSAPELATGGRDGRAAVWDPRVGSSFVAEVGPLKGKVDCWAVALGNSTGDGSGRCLCVGYGNGRVAMFDLRAGGPSPLWARETGKGICGVAFDRADIEMNKLLTAGIDARLCAYDLRTRHPTRGFAFTEARAVGSEASTPTAWFARPLPQNRELSATGTGNGILGIWRYEYPAQRCRKGDAADAAPEGVPGKLVCLAEEELTTQPLVSLDWNASQCGLGVCAALDQTIKVVIVTKLHKI